MIAQPRPPTLCSRGASRPFVGGGVFDTPTPHESARASASAGAVSHEFGAIGTGSGFPETHRIELSANPAIQP